MFEPDEEAGGYTVTCPALPGLITEGDMLEEARAIAADAVRCYLESLRKDGLPFPLGEAHETKSVRESITVQPTRAKRALPAVPAHRTGAAAR